MARTRGLIAKQNGLARLMKTEQVGLDRTPVSLIDELYYPMVEDCTDQALAIGEMSEDVGSFGGLLLLHHVPPGNNPFKVVGLSDVLV